MHIKYSSSCSIGGRKKNRRRKSGKSSLSCCKSASHPALPTHSCFPNTAGIFMEGVQLRPVRTSIFMMCLDPEWAKMNPSCFMVFWIPCIWLLCSQQSFEVGTENSWCVSRFWSSFNLLTCTVIWQRNWCILKPPCACSLSKTIIVPIYLMFSYIENRRHVFTGNNRRIRLKKGFVT